MKKRGIFLFLMLVLLVSSVSAEANETLKTDEKGYQCLQNQINNRPDISLQEAVFSALALGANSKALEKINSEKGDGCWPSGGCTIKDSAQVMLAYQRIGESTTGIESWLNSTAGTPDELFWLLEIDIENHGPAECKIKYGETANTIQIESDSSLSGSGSPCFTVDGYFLRIADSCINTKFSITCDQDFLTTIIYKKKGAGDVVFIPSKATSTSSDGTTEEKIIASCFKSEGKCDYEGTLWAALALDSQSKSTSQYMPYLLALAPDNEKYFPSAFLYILRGGDDQYDELVANFQNKYWQIPSSPYSKAYDTSLGMLATSSANSPEFNSAKSYLAEIQDKDSGCWDNNNILDTAFILYSGWSRSVSKSAGVTASALCEEAGKFCVKLNSCPIASVLSEFECTSFAEECCSEPAILPTCSDKSGLICKSGEECSGQDTLSSDANCCLGTCEEIKEDKNLCKSNKIGVCNIACSEDEEKDLASCPSPQICCKDKEKKSFFWLWVILIILIILLLLAIFYRKKIQLWYYQRRSSTKITPVPQQTRPAQSRPFGPFPQKAPYSRIPQRPIQKKSSPAEKEIEETLKKLRQI